MELYKIESEYFKLDGGAMFGVVPKVLWHKQYPADENNLCNWAMRCLLIVDGNKRILIDTGIGNKQDESFLKYYYLNGPHTLEKSLKKHGFSNDDITDVIVTHLHFDHSGGCISYNEDKTELVPTFKNAQYHISKSQWETAINPNSREKASFLQENFLPLKKKGHLNLIEKNSELFQNIHLRLMYGHTDGQIIPFVHHNKTTFIYSADLMPSEVHLPLPYVMSYDMQPLVSLKEKEELLKESLKNEYILFFEHDVYNECCSLQQTKKGIRSKKVFTLNEYLKNSSQT